MNGPAVVMTAITIVVWVANFVHITALRRSVRQRPGPGAPTMDLRDEPPAVANLLVNGVVTRDALPATLIDLAARRELEIFATEPRRFACRLRPSHATQPLLPYEALVRDVVQRAAPNGSVDVTELAAATARDTTQLWLTFGAEVRADAARRGLTHRVTLGSSRLTALLFVASFGCFALAGGAWLPQLGPLWFFGAVGVGVVESVYAFRGLGSGLTEAGGVATAHWLGVRDYLREHEQFSHAAADSVAVWDRYLAYGVALDVNDRASSELLVAFRRGLTRAEVGTAFTS